MRPTRDYRQLRSVWLRALLSNPNKSVAGLSPAMTHSTSPTASWRVLPGKDTTNESRCLEVYREIILACGKCLELPGEIEVKDVLSCCNQDRFIPHPAMEIDSPQFAGYLVSLPSALWCPATGMPVGILLPLTGRLARATCAREPGTGFQCGNGGTISPREIDSSTREDAEDSRTRG